MDELPKRKRIRLKDYDYSSNNAYFVTICTKDKKCILSRTVVGQDAHIVPSVELLPYGKIVDRYIRSVPGIDKYVIMPNHIHMIIKKEGDCGSIKDLNRTSLSSDVRTLKTLVTKEIGKPIWQKSFYDHVIRNEKDYLTIWEYIDNNPAKWAEDKYNLEALQ